MQSLADLSISRSRLLLTTFLAALSHGSGTPLAMRFAAELIHKVVEGQERLGETLDWEPFDDLLPLPHYKLTCGRIDFQDDVLPSQVCFDIARLLYPQHGAIAFHFASVAPAQSR